jgi:hypothetical protein
MLLTHFLFAIMLKFNFFMKYALQRKRYWKQKIGGNKMTAEIVYVAGHTKIEAFLLRTWVKVGSELIRGA